MTFLLTFSELGAAPCGVKQDGGAARADHDRVSVREDGGDPVAAGALREDNVILCMIITLATCLDVHEEGVWMLHQPLQLVQPPLG